MVGALSGFKIGKVTRVNDGTSSDLSQVVATQPGWLHGVQAFNVSSATLVHLKLFDSSAAITTASLPFWQGVIPFYGSLSTGSLTDIPGGAGFTWDNAGPIPFNNGLAYCIGGNIAQVSQSTIAANQAIVNLQFQTSSVG